MALNTTSPAIRGNRSHREAAAELARCGWHKRGTILAASSKLMIAEAERRLPMPDQTPRSDRRLWRTPDRDARLARPELRHRWLGDEPGWVARRRQRCARDLLPRRCSGCSLHVAMVRCILHIPDTQLRLAAGEVGGSFGMKGGDYPEYALALWDSRKTGRPVKWIAERSEACSPWWSRTIRTARARTSREYGGTRFVIAPSSQELKPPTNPARFTFKSTAGVECGAAPEPNAPAAPCRRYCVLRCQPEPGGELTAAPEQPGIGDRRGNRTLGDRTDPGARRQAAAVFVGPVAQHYPLFELADLDADRLQLLDQHRAAPARSRQASSRVPRAPSRSQQRPRPALAPRFSKPATRTGASKNRSRPRGPKSRGSPSGGGHLPTRAVLSLIRALRDTRGSSPWTPETTVPQPPAWVPIGRRSRVPVLR